MNLAQRSVLSWPCLLGSLVAQAGDDESRGPLAGAATAFAIDSASGGTIADATARIRRNGVLPVTALTLPAGSQVPNLGAILQSVGAPANLDLDDYSLGREDVMFDAAGHSAVPPNRWVVLSFSLRNGATGQPGSRIAEEVGYVGSGNVGASLFSWIQDGDWLPAHWVDRVERSHTRQELGVPVGANVDAVDFTAMLGIDQGTLTGLDPAFAPPLTPGVPAVYFTVSHATRGSVPNAWWGTAPLDSGATILVTTRSPASGQWSTPSVFKYWYEIGLQQDDDIDGLAIDIAQQRILFSLAGTAANQFLVVDYGTDGTPVPAVARKPGGQPVSDAVGAGGLDDVDAICTLDPQIGTTGGPPPAGDDFGHSCGTPFAPGVIAPPTVHASAYRRFENGMAHYDTFLVGWPPNTGATAGLAALFARVDGTGPYFPIGVVLRNTAAPLPGDPQRLSITIPNGYAFHNHQVSFHWIAIAAGFSELAEAWPIRAFL